MGSLLNDRDTNPATAGAWSIFETWYADWDVETAANALTVDPHPADHPARVERERKLDAARATAAEKRAAVRPADVAALRKAAASVTDRRSLFYAVQLIQYAAVVAPTADELRGWAEAALRYADTHGPAYRTHLLVELAGRLTWRSPQPLVGLHFATQAVAATAPDSWPRMTAVGSRGDAFEQLGRAAEAAADHAEYDRLHAELNVPITNADAVAAQRKKLGDDAGRMAGKLHTATFAGRVTAAGGKPVAGATVTFNGGMYTDRSLGTSADPVVTAADGTFTLPVRYTGRTMYSPSLNVSAPGYVTRTQVRLPVQVLGSMTAPAFVTLDLGVVLSGVVKVPVPNHLKDEVTPATMVWRLEVKGSDGEYHSTETRPGGRFELTLRPGVSYTITTDRSPGESWTWAGVRAGRGEVVLDPATATK
jgi:hypothetical protein